MPPMLMPPSVIWITASCSVLWASSYLYVKSHLSESFRWDLWAIFPSVSVMNSDGVLGCQTFIHVCVTINKVIRIPWPGLYLSVLNSGCYIEIIRMQFQTLKSSSLTPVSMWPEKQAKYHKHISYWVNDK